jgi:hypothetical protein
MFFFSLAIWVALEIFKSQLNLELKMVWAAQKYSYNKNIYILLHHFHIISFCSSTLLWDDITWAANKLNLSRLRISHTLIVSRPGARLVGLRLGGVREVVLGRWFAVHRALSPFSPWWQVAVVARWSVMQLGGRHPVGCGSGTLGGAIVIRGGQRIP